MFLAVAKQPPNALVEPAVVGKMAVCHVCNSKDAKTPTCVTLRWTRPSMLLPLSTLGTNEHQPT